MQIFAFSKRFPWMFRKRKKREMCEGFVALRVFLVYCESDLRFIKNFVSITVSKTWKGSQHYTSSDTPSETVWIIYVSIDNDI